VAIATCCSIGSSKKLVEFGISASFTVQTSSPSINPERRAKGRYEAPPRAG
jgi:hypothetical protein